MKFIMGSLMRLFFRFLRRPLIRLLRKVLPPRGTIVNRHKIGSRVLKGQPNRVVVLYPGFSKFSWDWLDIARYLNETLDYTVYLEDLPGHESHEALCRSRSWRSLPLVEKRLLEIWEKHGRCPVAVGGISMGSALTTIVAARHPDKFIAQVIISAPLELTRLTQLLIWICFFLQWVLFPLKPLISRLSLRATKSEYGIPRSYRRDRPYHTRYPICAATSILWVQILMRFALLKLKRRPFVAFPLDDTVIPARAAEIVIRLLHELDPFVMRFTHGPHVLVLAPSSDQQLLAGEIGRYLERSFERPEVFERAGRLNSLRARLRQTGQQARQQIMQRMRLLLPLRRRSS